MINPFVMKKYATIILSCILSTMSFVVVTMYYNLVYGIIAYIVAIGLSLIIGNTLMADPFRKLVEGKGMLVLNMDSTGVIDPFIVEVLPPNVTGVFRGQAVQDSFDRNTVFQLNFPKTGKAWTSKDKDGEFLNISLTQKDYNSSRMALYSYPVLFWNDCLKTLMPKSFLATLETQSLAKHGILFLTRVLQGLSTDVKNFGRYVVENLKPNKGLFSGNWWVWLLIIGFLALLGIMIIPKLLPALSGALGNAGETIKGATVTPAGG